MLKIYLIRHCAAVGQAPSAPLTTDGQTQALQLADCLVSHHIHAIVSSPFIRAIQTIEPFAKRVHLPVQTDARLTERVLATETLEDWLTPLRQSFNDLDFTCSGGESNRIAMERAVAAVTDATGDKNKNVAIVTHGNLMTLLLKHFDDRFGFDEWANLSNPDVYVVSIEKQEAKITRIWDNGGDNT